MQRSRRLRHVIIVSIHLVYTFCLVSEVLGNPSNFEMIPCGFITSRHPIAFHRVITPIGRTPKHRTPNSFSKEGTQHGPAYANDSRLFTTNSHRHTINDVAIVGGGLAGLSTACAMLLKNHPSGLVPRITIIDREGPGCGGASAVAGGLLHPFSPRGKLVHLGREGLTASNALLEIALMYEPKCVIRDQLYRIAVDEKYKTKLKETAVLFPEYAKWLEASDIQECCGTPSSLGGIVLSNGCKVIHVPSYLQGLWKACQDLSGGTATWCIEGDDSSSKADIDWKKRLSCFDTVVLSAGSGLIHDSILSKNMLHIPAMLVRGQSIEMSLQNHTASMYPNEAVLCGKYITPMSSRTDKVLIGATHEFQTEKMDETEVYDELCKRSIDFLPHVWKHGQVDRITCGYRVQTQRGKYGRMPIIGRAQTNDVHDNAWLFTGLSSRGLIHHSIYGNILCNAILEDDENIITELYPELLWWKSMD